MFLYVLQLENDKYYVGKSTVPDERIIDHFSGNGSGWTRKYKPIRIITVKACTGPTDEDQLTKELMGKYGIENVRGGSYCTTVLSPQEINCLLKEIRGIADCCYRCGRIGHFINDCYAKTDINGVKLPDDRFCHRCHRPGHSANVCYAKTDVRGIPLKTEVICNRCGRPGHLHLKCYAKKHQDGSILT